MVWELDVVVDGFYEHQTGEQGWCYGENPRKSLVSTLALVFASPSSGENGTVSVSLQSSTDIWTVVPRSSRPQR